MGSHKSAHFFQKTFWRTSEVVVCFGLIAPVDDFGAFDDELLGRSVRPRCSYKLLIFSELPMFGVDVVPSREFVCARDRKRIQGGVTNITPGKICSTLVKKLVVPYNTPFVVPFNHPPPCILISKLN